MVLIAALCSSFSLFAQNEVDALRYSRLIYDGTARYNSMGGAFSSLGGDFSVLNTNPAGLGVFRSSELSFTPSFVQIHNDTKYAGNSENDFNYNFNIGNLSYVGTALLDDETTALKSLNFGIGYNRLKNFNENILIEGENMHNSLTDYLASRANGYKPGSLGSFYAWPAWEAYLIDPANADTTAYESSFPNYGETQTAVISRNGHMGEFHIALAANLNNQFYVGATFGIQSIDFEETKTYHETDPSDIIEDFNSFTMTEYLKTDGVGYNMKLGAIYRPLDWIRVGGAIHTPTFFNLSDEYSTSFSSDFEDPDKDANNLRSGLGTYDYKLVTPFKANGGLSFILLNSIILSGDVEYMDYRLSRLRAEYSDGYDFHTENDNISNEYQASLNYRAGLEYRIAPVAFRGGFAYYSSPYASDHVNHNADLMQISGGIGYRSKYFYIDMAYVYSLSEEDYYLYEGFGVSSFASDIATTRDRKSVV